MAAQRPVPSGRCRRLRWHRAARDPCKGGGAGEPGRPVVRLIADLTVVEIADGPHNIGWTHPGEVNAAFLDFLRL